MNLISNKVFFRNLFFESSNLNILFISISFLFTSIVGFFAFYSGLSLYILGIFVGLLIGYFLITKPKLWIYLTVLLQITFVRESSKGLTATEALTAIVFSIGLFIWFINKLLIKKERIVEDYGDWLILFFMLAIFLNFITSIAYGVIPLDWFREYNLFGYLLYYFPIKDLFKEKEDLKKLLLFIIVVLFVMELFHFYDFYTKIRSNIIYAYQYGRSLQRSQTMFVATGIFLLTFTFYQKNKINKYLMLFMSSLTVSALISTFSRTFWLYFIVAMSAIFIYLPNKFKINLLMYLTVIIFVVAAGFYIAAKDNVGYMAKIYLGRLTSSSEGAKDISMLSRFKEWEAVQKRIEQYPLGGSGLMSTFRYYNILEKSSVENDIVHNGYLWLTYRVGIPLALVFVLFFGYKIFKSFILLFNLKDTFYKNLIFCTLLSLVSIMVSNSISNQFIQRDCLFTIAFLLVFVSFADRQIKLEKLVSQNNVLRS